MSNISENIRKNGRLLQSAMILIRRFRRTICQAQGFIQSVGYGVSDFWQESNGLAESNDMVKTSPICLK